MSINRRIAEEAVVHIHNGIILNHKKEQNCVICKDMDGPRDCHTFTGFLELRQAPGVYSRVTTGMPILSGSLFSEVRTLV